MTKKTIEKNPMLGLVNGKGDDSQDPKDVPTKETQREKASKSSDSTPKDKQAQTSQTVKSQKAKPNGKRYLSMRFNSIWNSAWKGDPEPEDLSFGEKNCYFYVVLLSKMYYAKMLTKEEGKQHKAKLWNYFMYNFEQEETLLKCGTAIKLLANSTDPNVQKVVQEVNGMFTDASLPWHS